VPPISFTTSRSNGLLSVIRILVGCCIPVLAAPAAAVAAADCFPDRVVSLETGFVSAPPAFNSWQPGIVLGPPGDATPTSGSLSVIALGHGGSIVLEFTDNAIVDGQGPDFIVFENPFFCTLAPTSQDEPYSVLAEPGIVAVSEDGIDYHTFPHDAAALSEVVNLCSDKELLLRLAGLMGITPSFTGNYTVPNDPQVFDTSAPAGISGHGGDAFDLADVGLSRARFVRITDPDLSIGIPGPSEGLDLDTVVAIHSEPLLGPGRADRDGDGLPDLEETILYLTDPDDPDSDGDGSTDGVEAASCRDPRSAGTDPFALPLLDLEVGEPAATTWRWSLAGAGLTYDVIRGEVSSLRAIGGMIDLGIVACIEDGSTDLTTRGLPDETVPSVGSAFFYAVRSEPDDHSLGYGHSSVYEPRIPASGDCP
jgi:hypothetical protein